MQDLGPERGLEGRLYVTDPAGASVPAYGVTGVRNGDALDLHFTPEDASATTLSGTFLPLSPTEQGWQATELEGVRTEFQPPTTGWLVPQRLSGVDPALDALISRGLVDATVADKLYWFGDLSERETYLTNAQVQTWSLEQTDLPALNDLLAEFAGTDIIQIVKSPNAFDQPALVIKPGYEDVVVLMARQYGFDLTADDLPEPTTRHALLVAAQGNVIPLDAQPIERQPVVRGRLAGAISPPMARVDLRPYFGTDFRLTVLGSGPDFGLAGRFKFRFYRLVFRLAVGIQPGDAPGTFYDSIRVIFERGEVKLQNGAGSIDDVDLSQGFSNIEDDAEDNLTVPEAVVENLADLLSTAFNASRGG